MSGFGSNSFGGFSNTNTPAPAFGGFDNNNAPAPTFGFGAAPPPPLNTNNNPPVFGGGSGGGASFGGTGQPAAFGAAGPAPSAFGQPPIFGQPAPASGGITFGQSTSIAPVVANTGTNFGGGGYSQQPSFNTTTTPFGQPSSSTGMSFGTSSTIAPTNPSNPTGGFGSTGSATSGLGPFGNSSVAINSPSATAGSFGNFTSNSTMSTAAPAMGPFGTSNVTTRPFGAPASSTSMPTIGPFGQPAASTTVAKEIMSHSDDEGMTMGDDPAPLPASNLPFGQPVQLQSSSTAWSRSKDSASAPSPGPSQQDKLAEMKAKIAAKKKKLDKLKIKNNKPQLNANAQAFKPAAAPPSPIPRSMRSRSTSPIPNKSSMAQFLPDDLKDQNDNPEAIAASNALLNTGNTRDDQTHLDHAVTLMGTCQHMCPDEEILRRQRESDIQLLERLMPDGTFHPKDWTLRNTMVKRFRRSAADYKLDVPEWVRPADVLENVCGYLEEWVMDRDRQGPDPRFNNNATPNPLDVYQFIWDRTRMIRKDFTLQNYVGTGGNCDARAVRCHERIARWHTMCEHQLSHIPDFVTQQSQQNIQELGQALISLNQFYDDTQRRCLVEVASATDGSESRPDSSSFDHGCKSDHVNGAPPVDYDGKPLANEGDPAMASRLVGKNAVNSPHHGTAEPEMRGLYILQTMNNDGGMEVRKYASQLSQERPEVFHTAPVQLAMSIFKAKKDNNYARFFKILRSPSTPYLFACLMFKHVEDMRKEAIKTCSRAYGGKLKDGSIIGDTYPLKTLTEMLCFEDDEEAKAACRHYNITVKKAGDGREYVLWRRSQFRRPFDEEKNVYLRLRPRKMVRTVESKLRGATRLAVCRGQVSGEGAFLSPEQINMMRGRSTMQNSQQALQARAQARTDAQRVFKERETVREREAVSRRLEDERRQQEMQQRVLAQQKALQKEEEEKKRQAALTIEQERKAREKREQERVEKERAELRLNAEKKRQAKEEERRRKLEAERLEAIRLQQEEQRRKAEEERLRQIEIDKQRQREERRRQQIESEAERKRQAAEAERLRIEKEEAKRQRLIQEQILREKKNKELEAAAKREKEELMRRVNEAKEMLIWRRLKAATDHIVKCSRTGDFDVIQSRAEALGRHLRQRAASERLRVLPIVQPNLTLILDRMSRDYSETVAAAAVASIRTAISQNRINGDQETLLLRIGVRIPQGENPSDYSNSCIARKWFGSQFQFRRVYRSDERNVSLRVVFVDCGAGSDTAEAKKYDIECVVLPPPWSDALDQAWVQHDIKSILPFPGDTPVLILCLGDKIEPSAVERKRETLLKLNREASFVHNLGASREDLDAFLLQGADLLAKSTDFVGWKTIQKVSVSRFLLKCLEKVLWSNFGADQSDVFALVNETIHEAMDHLDSLRPDIFRFETMFPISDFVRGSFVENYFLDGSGLPMNWTGYGLKKYVEPEMRKYADLLRSRFADAITVLITDAPAKIQDECQNLFEKYSLRQCFYRALAWRVQVEEEGLEDCSYVYLPSGMLDQIVCSLDVGGSWQVHIKAVETEEALSEPSEEGSLEPEPVHTPPTIANHEDSYADEIEFYPVETPLLQPEVASKRPIHENIRSHKKQKRAEEATSVADSRAFTAKLERLLKGEEHREMFLGQGKTTLSRALRGAPPPQWNY